LAAGAELARGRAGDIVAAHGGETSAAAAAAQEGRQQVDLPLLLPEPSGLDRSHAWLGRKRTLPQLDPGPERVIDDAQGGDLCWALLQNPDRGGFTLRIHAVRRA
jgi:hypothetical protein